MLASVTGGGQGLGLMYIGFNIHVSECDLLGSPNLSSWALLSYCHGGNLIIDNTESQQT